jgi:hypothetical protein
LNHGGVRLTGGLEIKFFDLNPKVKSRTHISRYIGKFTAQAFRYFLANTQSDAIALDFQLLIFYSKFGLRWNRFEDVYQIFFADALAFILDKNIVAFIERIILISRYFDTDLNLAVCR